MGCTYKVYVIAQVTYGILATVCLLLYVLFKRAFFTREESLVGKTVVVTKAGRELGKEIAKQFSREGASVICWDEEYQACMDTVYDIRHGGGEAIGFKCNVTDASEVIRTITATMKRVGHIDVLVNNADMHSTPPPMCWDETELRHIFDKNMFSHFWVIKGILPFMRSINKGHIIVVTPTSHLPSSLNDVSHAACKFAVTGMLEALLQEIRRTPGNKLRTTCIHPYGSPPKGTTSLQLKFRIMPRSTEMMAKEILKGIKSGHEVFSVPQKIFWYSNVLRCLPQEIERFWTNFIYKSTRPEEDSRTSERILVYLPPITQRGDHIREHPGIKGRHLLEKFGEKIRKEHLPLFQKRDVIWKIAKPENPSEETPVIFYSKDKWKLIIQEKSQNSLRTAKHLNPLDTPGTSYSPQYNDSIIIDITSDSVCTLDIGQSVETVASERLDPSWLTKVTESLIYSDWLNQLYEPYSTIVLPASRHYLTPWTLKINALFSSRSRVQQQSIISLENQNTPQSQNISQKIMQTTSSGKEREPANKKVTFIESEVQINVTHLNDNEEHQRESQDKIFNAVNFPENPELSHPSSSHDDHFVTPHQSSVNLPQKASSKLIVYYIAPDKSNNSINSNLPLQNEENKTDNSNIIRKSHTFIKADVMSKKSDK